MDPERRRQLAQRGGRRAHELGLAHVFDSQEARAAGKKGGKTTGAFRKQAAADRAEVMERAAAAQVPRGECSKCGMPGPEHKMCAGRPVVMKKSAKGT